MHDQAFNIGRARDNVQVRDIAEMVRDTVPGWALSFAGPLSGLQRPPWEIDAEQGAYQGQVMMPTGSGWHLA